jgi:hypothetical protein
VREGEGCIHVLNAFAIMTQKFAAGYSTILDAMIQFIRQWFSLSKMAPLPWVADLPGPVLGGGCALTYLDTDESHESEVPRHVQCHIRTHSHTHIEREIEREI